jgi:hypothetical protein
MAEASANLAPQEVMVAAGWEAGSEACSEVARLEAAGSVAA